MSYTRYDDSTASSEPIDIIRANECEYDAGSLSTRRFRRLWNEIVDLNAEIERIKALNDKG